MLINQTMDKLAQMKLHGLLDGLREQLQSPAYLTCPSRSAWGCSWTGSISCARMVA